MRALASKAKVKTRYGGRYVQAVNGIEGSLSAQRDWFWFVNGYEGDRSAASYRLHDGEWPGSTTAAGSGKGRGAGRRRCLPGAVPARLRREDAAGCRPLRAGLRAEARKLGAGLGADEVAPLGTPVPAGANVLELRGGASSLTAAMLAGETAGPGALSLLARPIRRAARRYSIP